ncbi:MAG: 50S ribosomal protein L6 [Candidatus Omnitrophica bacterium]|nr:50S ribosomal protein L6 [Candidatus Omnitrophota bacterium]
MSRIGKKGIPVPNTVKVIRKDRLLKIQGPQGELSIQIPNGIEVSEANNTLVVTRNSDEKNVRALHGTTRSLLANMVKGVTEGFKKELEIEGVGFRAQLKGKTLSLLLGFSHAVDFPIPDGITIQIPTPTQVIVQGSDKAKVGEIASEIRSFFKPEPYKGKGIHYVGETIRRKAGKTVA